MAAFVDTAQGIFHFLADRVPSGLATVQPRPRSANLWRQDGMPVVSKVTASGEVGAKVVVGESSGGMWSPTRKTMAKAGLTELLSGMGVGLVAFDDHPRDWVRITSKGAFPGRATRRGPAIEATNPVFL